MKKIVTALLLCVAAGTAGAQTFQGDYANEIEVRGGYMFFGTPHNAQYTGTNNNSAGIYGVNYYRNLNDNWQVGLEAMSTKWDATGTQQVTGLYGEDFGQQTTKYVYAKNAFTFMASINRTMQHYTEFNFLRSSFYYGVSGGLAFTNNDGLMTYSNAGGSTSSESRYLSEYHYEQGRGFVVGIQGGFNIYVGNHFGFNIEAAPRFTKIYTDNSYLTGANNRYSLFYFPFTAGLRFRF